MHIQSISKSIMNLLVLVTITFSQIALGAVFVKYDGVDGESKDANHKNWIDVLAVTKTPVNTDDDCNRQDTPDIQGIKITKRIDKSSTKLQEAACHGDHVGTLEIHAHEATHVKNNSFYRYILERATVKNFEVTTMALPNSGEVVPVEEVTFNYERIKVNLEPTNHQRGS